MGHRFGTLPFINHLLISFWFCPCRIIFCRCRTKFVCGPGAHISNLVRLLSFAPNCLLKMLLWQTHEYQVVGVVKSWNCLVQCRLGQHTCLLFCFILYNAQVSVESVLWLIWSAVYVTMMLLPLLLWQCFRSCLAVIECYVYCSNVFGMHFSYKCHMPKM